MTTEEVAEIVQKASMGALRRYLDMCRLDSPWEVPESFLAAESAKALADAGLRVAIEFKFDRASNHPSRGEINRSPVRLQKAYAHLDVAILKSEPDRPWEFTVDGIIEFKKHSSLADDADLIEFMIYDAVDEPRITYGVLAFLVVGPSEQRVTDEETRLISALPHAFRWQKLANSPQPEKYPSLPVDTSVGDRWWTICCLTPFGSVPA